MHAEAGHCGLLVDVLGCDIPWALKTSGLESAPNISLAQDKTAHEGVPAVQGVLGSPSGWRAASFAVMWKVMRPWTNTVWICARVPEERAPTGHCMSKSCRPSNDGEARHFIPQKENSRVEDARRERSEKQLEVLGALLLFSAVGALRRRPSTHGGQTRLVERVRGFALASPWRPWESKSKTSVARRPSPDGQIAKKIGDAFRRHGAGEVLWGRASRLFQRATCASTKKH